MAEDLWTVLRVLKWTSDRFKQAEIESARLDAELLIAHAIGRDRVYLYTHFDQPLSPEERERARELVQARLAGTPCAYLTGQREFYSLTLEVDRSVLIPRPETELLVDWVRAHVVAGGRVVDVGTGSGAIALAVRSTRPDLAVLATDCAEDSLAVARRNAARLALSVEFFAGDLLAGVPRTPPFAAVLANLPYIPSGQVAGLAVEVRSEPHRALDGGPDGLDLVRRLIDDAPAYLAPGGHIALEIGAGQAPAVCAFLNEHSWRNVSAHRDLAGIERLVTGNRADE